MKLDFLDISNKWDFILLLKKSLKTAESEKVAIQAELQSKNEELKDAINKLKITDVEKEELKNKLEELMQSFWLSPRKFSHVKSPWT